MEKLKPTSPPAPYIGGKRILAARIIEEIKAIPHECYVEPFFGMGGVFFRRPFRANAEVVNDINGDVVNLFRVLQRHFVAFMEMLKWQVTSREQFDRLVASQPIALTDMERAARFLYLQRTAFGGKVGGQTFGVSTTGSARFDIVKVTALLEDVHERLARVVIECLPYRRVIEVYDRPTTLFYLDPPYWDCEADYGAGLFAKTDFESLAEQLVQIKGRFLLSLNDRPEVRRIFKKFRIVRVEGSYSINGRSQKRAHEVLISGR